MAHLPENIISGQPTLHTCLQKTGWILLRSHLLKELGYYNAFFGKWHIGEGEHEPVHQGFDEQHFVTPWGAPTRYYPPYFTRWEDHPYPGDSTKTYLTDTITETVDNFIQDYHEESPFHISLYYYNVHHPHIGKIEWVRKYRSMGYDEQMAQYLAMVSALDESVGAIIEALKDKNILKNTVVIFSSDQGGYFENPPYSGTKMRNTLYEGGTRVPLLIKYGDHYPSKAINTPVFTYDLFPTLVALAGGEMEDNLIIDGVNLLPLINGTDSAFINRPVISYRSYENQYISLLDENWKFVGYRDGRTELFDLENDIKETTNLSRKNPDKVKKYIEEIIAWEKEKGVFEYSGFK